MIAAIDVLPIEGTQIRWVEELPVELPGGARIGPYAQASLDDALLELPSVGRFRVRDGRQVEIEIAAGCTRERAASFARISPFGALIHQRGELPLHASAVMRPEDGKVLLIAGTSGTGKSTTAAAFARRGWRVLNDDISRVTASANGILAWPGFHRLKLWDQSCGLLNIDRTDLPLTGEFKQKYFWCPERAEGPGVLGAVVELCGSCEGDGGLQQIRGAAAVRMLFQQTFRRRLIQPLGRKHSHFNLVANVAKDVPCFRFDGCHRFPPNELARQLESVLH